jgi:hypothetical protein
MFLNSFKFSLNSYVVEAHRAVGKYFFNNNPGVIFLKIRYPGGGDMSADVSLRINMKKGWRKITNT